MHRFKHWFYIIFICELFSKNLTSSEKFFEHNSFSQNMNVKPQFTTRLGLQSLNCMILKIDIRINSLLKEKRRRGCLVNHHLNSIWENINFRGLLFSYKYIIRSNVSYANVPREKLYYIDNILKLILPILQVGK